VPTPETLAKSLPEHDPEVEMNCTTETTGVVEEVRSQLRGNPYQALKQISCEYRDGTLILHGRLPSYYLKQVAQTAVARVAGVERVVNHIEVATALREAGCA
jgi:osmotically-inducible protein OsmY